MAIRGFYAYPSSPKSVGDAVEAAVEHLNGGQIVSIQSWTKTKVGGKFIIQEICKTIDDSEIFCADLTGINPNVLFELGYAIATDKRIWISLDRSYADFKKQFEQLRVFTTVGYADYRNSRDIADAFYSDQPYEDSRATLHGSIIEPSLHAQLPEKLFYAKSSIESEASIRITERVTASVIPQIIDDPLEAQIQTLTWYGTQIYSSLGVVCHLIDPRRDAAQLNNARNSLVAGLAYGWGRPLLILTEGDYLSPLDYRDISKQYDSSSRALAHLEEWLGPLETTWNRHLSERQEFDKTVRLATELRGFQLGEFVAENEADQLDYYFIETSAYEQAVNGKHSIFVGRKGAGKSANYLTLAATLASDKRNLVCQIKPVSYQLQSVANLVGEYTHRDTKSFALESLWKFLIYSEIANSLLNEIERSPASPTSAENELVDLMNRNDGMLRREFSVRLERCVESLGITQRDSQNSHLVESIGTAISEALHAGILRELRIVLGKLLTDRRKIVVLVDNLDKAWDRKSDLESLSEFFLGLLRAARRVSDDFRHRDSRRSSANISVVVFLRSDIFFRIKEVAAEPDKLDFTKLNWRDPELLLRVIEERFAALHEGKMAPSDIWNRYFCPEVKGEPTKEYFVTRVLFRPRDLIFFIKAAVSTAVNRRHTMVEERDVLEAEKLYSQFAIDSLLVEDGASISEPVEGIILEFLGCTREVDYNSVCEFVTKAHIPASMRDRAIDHLCSLTFLGPEVKDGIFNFADDPQENKKNQILARKLSDKRGTPIMYRVHPAYWPFLEID